MSLIRSGAVAAVLTCLAPTAGRASVLEDVNFRENAALRIGWAYDFRPGPVGDCKTYSANKRRDLLALGYAPERLVIWTVFDTEHRRHAVLVVDNATMLDNLNRWPIPIAEARATYQFLEPVSEEDLAR